MQVTARCLASGGRLSGHLPNLSRILYCVSSLLSHAPDVVHEFSQETTISFSLIFFFPPPKRLMLSDGAGFLLGPADVVDGISDWQYIHAGP
jgi:hypothetical protein